MSNKQFLSSQGASEQTGQSARKRGPGGAVAPPGKNSRPSAGANSLAAGCLQPSLLELQNPELNGQRQEATSPPDSNTGGKSPNEAKLAFIDWLAFTFTPPLDVEPLEWINVQLREVFNLPDSLFIEAGKGWYGYKHRIDLGQYGILAYGGESQLNSYHVELNAQGCSLVHNWHKVKQWGESHSARITRSDLAHDDHEGQTVSIQKAIDWYEEGGFTGLGRKPNAQMIDDFGSGKGKTVYIGAREYGKLCRVYEKGRQLGDKLSAWVRVEVELRNKSRVIPWDVVINPGHYLAGA